MKGFLSKLNLRRRKQNDDDSDEKKPKKKSSDDDAADENTNTNNRQKRKQRKTAQKIREKQAHAIERSANSVRAISGLASGSMRLLPNKNGKKPISTKTNVQGMVVGLAALGVARSMAERSVVAKKKKKRKEGVSSEEEEEEEDEEEEKRARRTTNGTTVKFAAMMATFIVKPVTFTGAFVLREVYRSALALLGETNKDDGSSSSLKNGGGESVLMTPPLTPKTPRSSRQSVNSSHDDDEDEDVGKSASDARRGDAEK